MVILRELEKIQQVPNEPARRWFSSMSMELIVWHDAERLLGFQLCYDKDKYKSERALTFWEARGFRHLAVDNGEEKPGKYKSSPILVMDGDFPAKHICTEFKKQSAQLDSIIVEYVLRHLQGYPNHRSAGSG